jgi:ADP-ribosylglycohydrolase
VRSIPFSFYQERVSAVLRARRVALASIPIPDDDRPHPDELTTLLVHTLETHGPRSGPLELADEWLDHLVVHWHEFGAALENLRLGIGPPTSGSFNNDAYGECAGGFALAQGWGLLHPGDPAGAAARAAECARVSHCGSAVEAARFLAAAASEALTAPDVRTCLRAGLRHMTPGSRAATCVQETLSVAAGEVDQGRAWTIIASDWLHPEPTDALANLAGAILALATGKLEWPRTLHVALATGGDAPTKACVCAAMLAAFGREVAPPKARRRSGRSATLTPGRFLKGLEMPSGDEDFVERLSRLAVACARPGEAEFSGAPYFPSPGPPVAGPVRLFARYAEEPVLAPGEERVVFLELADPAESVPGTLKVDADETLRAAALGGVTVPGQISARAVNVSLADEGGVPGVVRAEVRRAGRPAAVARFGFRRASRWVAVGPFENPDGAGLDHAHLPESRLDEKLVACGGPYRVKALRVPGDSVDVDAVFGSVGPRVLYLLRVVRAPSARAATFRIGCSDGLKVWLNGRRLLSDHRHGHGGPGGYVVPAALKAGANRITVKLARCGRSSVFRLRITARGTEEAMLELWDPF